MWVGQREFDDFKREVRRELDGTDGRLDRLTDEVSGLRGELKGYAKLGAALIALAGIAAPFVATYTARHI